MPARQMGVYGEVQCCAAQKSDTDSRQSERDCDGKQRKAYRDIGNLEFEVESAFAIYLKNHEIDGVQREEEEV